MGIILADNHMGFNHWHIIVLDNCTGIITYGSGASHHVGINSIYIEEGNCIRSRKGCVFVADNRMGINHIEVDNPVRIYRMY